MAAKRKARAKPRATWKSYDGPAVVSRLLRVECPVCGYTVRITRKWLALGPPLCPVHRRGMV